MTETLLYVFAHPDDETFGCGGSILHYAQSGKRQVLYCATRGDAGRTGTPPICTQAELGAVRSQELQRACDLLGIDQLHLREHPDGQLDQIPFEKLVFEIKELIEQERPAQVITFPPSGISGHKDHKIIQQATYTAVKTISFTTSLYYIVIPESTQINKKHTVHTVPDEDVTLTIDIRPYRSKIYQASLQHRTQNGSFALIHDDSGQNIARTHEHYQQVVL